MPSLRSRSSTETISSAGNSMSTSDNDLETKSQIRTLILDLGDVLFHWSARSITAVAPSTLHSIILSPAWGELECGRLDEKEAIRLIAEELSLNPDTICEALAQGRQTLRVDDTLVEQLKVIKKDMGENFKVYAMTNISPDDFKLLEKTMPDWSLFDGVFTSFEVGIIKPDLDYYKHVLRQTGLTDPSSAIFVDDKVANVNAARSFGVRGIVFECPAKLIRQLRNQIFDPVTRAQQYMKANARNHVSQIEGGGEFRDVFSQFLIHKVLHDPNIISLSPLGTSAVDIKAAISKAEHEARTWNYFIGPPVGTTKTFPDDSDDTAYALLAFSPPASSANIILDRFLANRHARDGLVQTYFCEKRPRVCSVVLVNVIRAFYHYGRGSDVRPEVQYVRSILENRGYVDGALEYFSAESFLYFVSCLVEANPSAREIQTLRRPLVAALRERVGRREDSFATAARVLACQTVGVWAASDVAYLKELQNVDGGWEVGWVCRYGRSKKRIGNRGVVTAFAIQALEQASRRRGV
ncbi:HAD-like protein [Plenodomus tracheiphilus IPT5]|uniref:HAD-like protein n=1 Tax=Plenodomus tracheiphilus IPT5 TaxID=1408161 RepID=A0A6A7AZY6_9PLEO|nr:HAD-like protein [Plenodomus tracheiphilus IPT5]